MGATRNSLLAAGIIALSAMSADAAGYRQLQVADADNPPLTTGVWYPSSQPVPSQANTEFELPVALDASIDGAIGGLIVISHGYSGWYGGHADTAAALADAGFIVAAPTHTGNTWSDMSSPIEKWLIDRPRHISRVIDHLLDDEVFADYVDESRIGVYGFSAGGYTAVGLIGGVPDLAAADQYCKQSPAEYVCADGLIAAMLQAQMQNLPPQAWGADNRITAAVVAAPGFGFAYNKTSLAKVTANVQLWSGKADKRVPTASNAAVLARNLPLKPEMHDVEQANHFAFLVTPCRESFKRDDPVEYEMVCGDAEGFNRYDFHDQMHVEMERFYKNSFAIE